MALSTYAELTAAIVDWVNDDALTQARAEDMVALFEAFANRFLANKRLTVMTSVNEAFVIDAEYETAPTDLAEVLALEIPSTTRPYRIVGATEDSMARMAPDQLSYSLWQNDIYGTDTSPPRYFAQVGNRFRFFPVPVTTYTARLTYTAKIPALSAGLNWLFTAHPDAYLYGALTEAEPFLDNDERVGTWKTKRDEAMAQILEAYPRARDFTGLRTELTAGRFPYR